MACSVRRQGRWNRCSQADLPAREVGACGMGERVQNVWERVSQALGGRPVGEVEGF